MKISEIRKYAELRKKESSFDTLREREHEGAFNSVMDCHIEAILEALEVVEKTIGDLNKLGFTLPQIAIALKKIEDIGPMPWEFFSSKSHEA